MNPTQALPLFKLIVLKSKATPLGNKSTLSRITSRFPGQGLAPPWPQPDAGALARDEIELVVQVNGKVRASIRVAAEAGDAAITAAALADANVQKYLEGKPIKFARVLKQRNLMTLAV